MNLSWSSSTCRISHGNLLWGWNSSPNSSIASELAKLCRPISNIPRYSNNIRPCQWNLESTSIQQPLTLPSLPSAAKTMSNLNVLDILDQDSLCWRSRVYHLDSVVNNHNHNRNPSRKHFPVLFSPDFCLQPSISQHKLIWSGPDMFHLQCHCSAKRNGSKYPLEAAGSVWELWDLFIKGTHDFEHSIRLHTEKKTACVSVPL